MRAFILRYLPLDQAIRLCVGLVSAKNSHHKTTYHDRFMKSPRPIPTQCMNGIRFVWRGLDGRCLQT